MEQRTLRAPEPARRRGGGHAPAPVAWRRPPVVDGVLATILGAGVLAEALVRTPSRVSPFAYLLVLAAAAPLVFRRRAPLRTLAAAGAGSVLCAAVLKTGFSVTAVVAVALFTVVLAGDRRRSLSVGVLTAVVAVVAILAIDGGIDAGGTLSRLAIVVLCVTVGEVIRTRGELLAARRLQAEQDARERAEELRRHAAAERLAIARELHDSLGHFLVAINVRASVAVEVPETQDPLAALADIKQVSAAALGDLRATLSVLRERDDQAPTAPSRGLEALPDLVARARSAGVDTQLELEVDTARVPAATGAAIVRIVQESLTNMLKHAEAAHARVSVRGDRGGMLAVEISDDGTAAAAPGDGGFGVLGMAERAAALGGHLHAGPRADGGWSVTARLPLDDGGRR